MSIVIERPSWVRRSRGVLFRASAVLLSVSVAAALVEGAARVREWTAGADAVPRWAFRASRPAPYRTAEYFCDSFLLESMRSLRLVRPGDAEYVVLADIDGQWISIRDHRRVTTDQPRSFDRRVLLFGGSTTQCLEVPDRHTAASYLQRALNERSETRWRVENLGTSSMTARQQTIRLLAEGVRPGDVVVFFDGVNDIYYPAFNGNPRGWLPGDDTTGGARRLNGVERRLAPLCLRASPHSAAARLVQRRIDLRPPNNVRPGNSFDRRLAACEEGFLRTLLEAREHAAAGGAEFLHVLQPHLFTSGRMTDYERRVRDNELKQFPGLDLAYESAYPCLRHAAEAFAVQGGRSADLSALFEDRPAGEEFYLDFCHVNHRANERIGRALCRLVLELEGGTVP
jgi:hypothetical protein